MEPLSSGNVASVTVATRFFNLSKFNVHINCVAPVLDSATAGFSSSGRVRCKPFAPSHQHSREPLALLPAHHLFSPSPLAWGLSAAPAQQSMPKPCPRAFALTTSSPPEHSLPDQILACLTGCLIIQIST